MPLSPRPHTLCAATALLVALLAGPESALAAALGYVDPDENGAGHLTCQAAPGERNRVTVEVACYPDDPCERLQITFRGTPLPRIGEMERCTRTASSVACVALVLGAKVYLGDGDDVASAVGSARPGDPELHGQAGNDVLAGGTYADNISGGLGDDRLTGGPGSDTALYENRTKPVRVDLRRASPQGVAGERDRLSGFENVTTGSAGDTLIGSAAANSFSSGAGADTIDTVGGGRDTVDCGRGIDTVRADPSDRLSGCERVTRVSG